MNQRGLISEDIIKKAMKGDVEAFTKIYEGYSSRVFYQGVQYFKNEDIAKDVVQEVFIKVFKQIDTLKDPNAFTSWLYMITYRICQNRNRRKYVDYELPKDFKAEDIADHKEINVIETIENERVNEVIMNSLNDMDESLKSVGMMRFYDDLKIIEIAKILDIPKGTVATRLTRIKKKLKEDLEKNGITKAFGFVAVSPTVLNYVHSMMIEQQSLNNELSNQILVNVLSDITQHSREITKIGKVISGGIAIVSIAMVAIFLGVDSEDKKISTIEPIVEEVVAEEIVEEIEEELPNIINVNYNDNWTNQNIFLDVSTSNNNFDQLLINDNEEQIINSNGTYKVKLIKNDEIISEIDLVITNIDRQSPQLVSETVNENYILYLADDNSGIDWNSVKHYKNAELINDFHIDYGNNSLIISNDNNHSDHLIYINDNAGNSLKIEIKDSI